MSGDTTHARPRSAARASASRQPFFCAQRSTTPFFSAAPAHASAPVQLLRQPGASEEHVDPDVAMDVGRRATSGPLPHRNAIEPAFGGWRLGSVRAYQGPVARAAANDLGAQAATRRDDIVFRDAPDLRTAAHEATHVVMQRAGLVPRGSHDRAAFESHADRVAARVTARRSAADILPAPGSHGSRSAVQLEENKTPEKPTSVIPKLFQQMFFPSKRASLLDKSLELKGTEWYSLWALASGLASSWGNMLLADSVSGKEDRDWWGTFEKSLKANGALFPGASTDFGGQLLDAASLIGKVRLNDYFGSDPFLGLLEANIPEVIVYALMAQHVVSAIASAKQKPEVGTMNNHPAMDHLAMVHPLAGAVFKGLMGKEVPGFSGMPKPLQLTFKQEEGGKGKQQGFEMLFNPSPFWQKGAKKDSALSHLQLSLFGKYLYDHPQTAAPLPTTAPLVPPWTEPSHSFMAGHAGAAKDLSWMLSGSGRFDDLGATSWGLRAGLGVHPTSVPALGRLQFEYELLRLMARDPKLRNVEPGLYHKLLLSWASGPLGKEWKVNASSSMAIGPHGTSFAGASAGLQWRKGGYPKDWEGKPGFGFRLFGGVDNPQWFDPNAPLGANVGLTANFGRFFAGGSYRWRPPDQRMRELYGNDAFAHEFGVNLGWLFDR